MPVSSESSRAGPSSIDTTSRAFTSSSQSFSSISLHASSSTISSAFAFTTTSRSLSSTPVFSPPASSTPLRTISLTTSSTTFFSSNAIAFSAPATSSSSSRAIVVVTSTTTATPVPSEHVIRPAESDALRSGWNAGEIAAVTACSCIILLGLVACGLFFFVRRRRQRRRSVHQNDPDPRNIEPIEKYREDDSQYTTSPTLGHSKSMYDTQSIAPLLKLQVPASHSRTTSAYYSYRDSQLYHDGPSSPFINGDDDTIKPVLRNAVSLSDAIPFPRKQESRFESVSLLPSSPPPLRPAALQLRPLSIPAYVAQPPSRRSSKNKRNTQRPSTSLDSGDDSDDTESLYSQASVSATSLLTARTRQSTAQSLPPPARPLSPIPQLLADIAAQSESPSFNRPASILGPLPSAPLGQTDEDAGRGEDIVLVAKLLESRQKKTRSRNLLPVTRSSTVISHIERKGSIKPALPSSIDDEEPPYLQLRRARAAEKSHPPTHSMEELPLDAVP